VATMSGLLDGKIALVTGGDRGIGKAVALALARAGTKVAVNYRTRAADAEFVCADIKSQGGRAVAAQADVSIAAQVAEMVRRVESQLGPVGILVNNAGISRLQPFDQISEQDWDEVLAVNLKSVFLVTQAVLPGMRAAKWGRIVNLSSVAAQTGGVEGRHPRPDAFLCCPIGQGGDLASSLSVHFTMFVPVRVPPPRSRSHGAAAKRSFIPPGRQTPGPFSFIRAARGTPDIVSGHCHANPINLFCDLRVGTIAHSGNVRLFSYGFIVACSRPGRRILSPCPLHTSQSLRLSPSFLSAARERTPPPVSVSPPPS